MHQPGQPSPDGARWVGRARPRQRLPGDRHFGPCRNPTTLVDSKFEMEKRPSWELPIGTVEWRGSAYVALPALHFIHSQALPKEEKKTMSLYGERKSL
jgi:hypothetical protein